MTPKQVCAVLAISDRTLWRLIQSGELPAHRWRFTRPGAQWRITIFDADLENYISAGLREPEEVAS